MELVFFIGRRLDIGLEIGTDKKGERVIIGFDVSTVSTGWAVLDGNKLIDYGSINIKGEMPERLIGTRAQVVELIKKYNPKYSGIEDMIAMRNGKVTKLLNMFSGVVWEACISNGVKKVYFVQSSSAKKHMGINSRGLKKMGLKPEEIKEKMVEAVEQMYRIVFVKDKKKFYRDCADAIAVVSKTKILSELEEGC